jgi:hypothetical protein
MMASVPGADDRREDELHARPGWIRFPVGVGDRVRFVGSEDDRPLRFDDEGTILLFELDPVKPYVHVQWDRTGTGIVPVSDVRNVADGNE